MLILIPISVGDLPPTSLQVPQGCQGGCLLGAGDNGRREWTRWGGWGQNPSVLQQGCPRKQSDQSKRHPQSASTSNISDEQAGCFLKGYQEGPWAAAYWRVCKRALSPPGDRTGDLRQGRVCNHSPKTNSIEELGRGVCGK